MTTRAFTSVGASNREPATRTPEPACKVGAHSPVQCDGRSADAPPKIGAQTLAEQVGGGDQVAARVAAGTGEVGAASSAATSQVASGSGSALPADARRQMEHAFATDFSDVRIHQGPEAAQLGARAFAQGVEIHFAPGQYDPHSERGLGLLGHELTHVVQQRAGRVAMPQGKGAPIVADPGLEAEADRAGAAAARGERVSVAGVAAGAQPKLGGAAPIQRSVGFELQTEWPIYEKVEGAWTVMPRGRALFKDASGKLNNQPGYVQQGGTFNFVVETDDGAEGAEAEFVTAPFDAKDDIKLTAHNMKLFEQAIGATPADGDGFKTLDKVNRAFREGIDGMDDPRDATRTRKLTPSTRTIESPQTIGFGSKHKATWFDVKDGRGQATISAPLKDFNSVLTLFDIQAPVIGDERAFGNAALYNAALERARRVTAPFLRTETETWDRLTGLLSLTIGTLWCAGEFFLPEDPEYVKSLCKVMLRNPFSAIYARLPTHEKAKFTTEAVLGMLGMDGAGKVFPMGFKVEDNNQAYSGPTRKEFLDSIINPASGNAQARDGDAHVIGMNITEQTHRLTHERDTAKLEAQNKLNRKDLLSRGWVKASAYAMGEVDYKADQMARVEWRGFHPRYVALDDFEQAATNVFDRVNRPTGAITPPVAYDPGKRKRLTVTADQLVELQLVELDVRRDIKGPGDVALVREVYQGPDQSLWRLVDVASPGAGDGKDPSGYKAELETHAAPACRYTFEAVFREDLVELKAFYRDDFEDIFPPEATGSNIALPGDKDTDKNKDSKKRGRSPSPERGKGSPTHSPPTSPTHSPPTSPTHSRTSPTHSPTSPTDSLLPSPKDSTHKSRKVDHVEPVDYHGLVARLGSEAANHIMSNAHLPHLVNSYFSDVDDPQTYWQLTAIEFAKYTLKYIGKM
jgi:hypothetical protein